MWVEYKWYEVRPRFWNLGKKLSRLQQKWLHRAFKNNRKVAVVAGYPGGYAVFIGDTWTYNDATKDWMTAKDVAQWIEFQVT